MIQRILVTGGAGFIGRHLVRALVNDGHHVWVVDDLSTSGETPDLAEAILIKEDVRHFQGFETLLRNERIEAIIHLAARVSVRRSLLNPLEDASTNVLGGIAVLDAGARAGVRRVVLASSGGTVYGEGAGKPSRENDPLNPCSPYGASKVALESYGGYYSRAGLLEISALRLANVYGPGQNPSGESGVIARFIDRLRKGGRIEIYGDGHQVRDYIYVLDVIRAIVHSVTGIPGTYNIGTGLGTSLLNILDILGAEKVGLVAPVFRQGIPGEVRCSVLDVKKAEEVLGWKHQIGVREGIRMMLGSSTPVGR